MAALGGPAGGKAGPAGGAGGSGGGVRAARVSGGGFEGTWWSGARGAHAPPSGVSFP